MIRRFDYKGYWLRLLRALEILEQLLAVDIIQLGAIALCQASVQPT
jgi:hypothetical protein